MARFVNSYQLDQLAKAVALQIEQGHYERYTDVIRVGRTYAAIRQGGSEDPDRWYLLKASEIDEYVDRVTSHGNPPLRALALTLKEQPRRRKKARGVYETRDQALQLAVKGMEDRAAQQGSTPASMALGLD